MTDDLWRWSAADLAQAIRTRRVSAREALASCLGRLEAVNARINAVVDVMADEALAAADAADAAVGRGEPLGPLHGVPVTVKINVDYAGRATTNGVVAFKDRIVKDDSAPVANLRKAGAVIFGRTNVPAFSTRYFTDNALHGRTLNPWDARRTPGGSSGGASAAVAAGIGPIGHGNDRAGSVRYPAYACGVFGLRPSFGRVPDFDPSAAEEKCLCSQFMHVQGPLARTVADIRLGLAALEQGDHRDPHWVRPRRDHARAHRPHPVAMLSSRPGVAIDPAVTAAVEAAGRWLEDAGYRVEAVAPPRLDEAADMFWSLLMTEEKAAASPERASSSEAIKRFGDDAVKRARAATRAYGTEFDFQGYVLALARRTTILREWNVLLERYPLILMPLTWQRPYPIDHDQKGDDAMRRMLDAFHPMLAVSTLGLPGLAAPTGTVDGVPMGVQLVAARFGEETCLKAGEVIEARAPMGTPIEPRG